MRTWIAAIVSKLVCRPPAFRTTVCPTLEQLEDRCVPSANMMMPMNMPMPPMTTQTAIAQLVLDFNQTSQQVQSSTTVQQFIANEVNMIQVLAADLAQIQMLSTMMGPMM
ncbi:MAG TPA: hypothetical protein VH592_18045 [Gemmataceae bacterium]|jgi:hypothetical protein